MSTILTANFLVEPNDQETIPQMSDRINNVVRDQLGALIKKQEPTAALEWRGRFTWQGEKTSTSLRWTEWQHSSKQELSLIECLLTYPVRNSQWETELRLGTTPKGCFVTAMWRSSTSSQIGSGLRNPPPLLQKLANALSGDRCQAICCPCDYNAQELTLDSVRSFHESIVLNPERCIPIILAAPSRNNGYFAMNVNEVAHRMFGLASVYRLRDDATSQYFQDIAGKSWACYDGAVRLYQPLQGRDKASQHPYRTARQIEANPQEAHKWLFEAVREASRQGPTDQDALRELTRVRHEDETAKWEREGVDNKELLHEWESASEERNHFRERNDRLQADIVRLEQKIAWQESRIEQLEQTDQQKEEREASSETLYLSSSAAAKFRAAPANQRRAFERQINKLGTALRNSQVKLVDHTKTDCKVFTRGQSSVRIFFFEPEEGLLKICELSSHHDETYEDFLQRGVFKKDYALDSFAQWPL